MMRLRFLLQQVFDHWFTPGDSWIGRVVDRVWLGALYLVGLYQWGQFFQWGDIPLDILDWGEITATRLYVMQDALQRGMAPLHTLLPLGMKGVSDRFLAIPDVPLSPQYLLLAVMPPAAFLLLNFFLLYSAGFAGLLLVRKTCHLGLAVFSALFLLFNLNGHIVGHLASGHATWMAYFLWPFFIALVFQLFESPQPDWKWILRLSLLALVVLLQGGYHHYVLMLMFLGLLGLFTPRLLRICFAGGAACVAVGLFRLLPAALVAKELDFRYFGGFPSLHELLRGLLTLVSPSQTVALMEQLSPYIAWWEFDYYIGWAGLLLIAGALVAAWRMRSLQITRFWALAWPCLVLAVLSIGRLYRAIFMLQIPMLDGERVGSRLFLAPFLFLLFLAAAEGQQLLTRRSLPRAARLVSFAPLALLASDLLEHMDLWNLAKMAATFVPFDIQRSQWVAANRADPLYTGLLITSVGLTLLSLGVIAWISAARPWLGLKPPARHPDSA